MMPFATFAQLQNPNAFLKNQIAQAKLQQDAYHHQEVMLLQQAKMELDSRMQSERLDFERYKFNQSMAAQREQSEIQGQTQVQVSQIQTASNEKQTLWQTTSNEAIAGMGIIGNMFGQQGQALQTLLTKTLEFELSEKMAQNNHRRQLDLLEKQAEVTQRQMKLQHRQEQERKIFEQNARLLEKVIDSKLKDQNSPFYFEGGFSYVKFSEFVSAMVEQILCAEGQKDFSENDMDKMFAKIAGLWSPF